MSPSISRRSKRVIRRVLLSLGALLALLVAIYLGIAVVADQRLKRTLSRLENTWGPLDFASLAPPEVPDEQNRAQALRAAIDRLHLDDDQKTRLQEMRRGPIEELSRREFETVEGMLAANQESLGLLQRAAGRPISNWGVGCEQLISDDTPLYVGLRELSDLNYARVLLALTTGNTALAEFSIHEGFGIAESLSQEVDPSAQLVRMSLNRVNTRALAGALSWNSLDDRGLSHFDERVRKSTIPLPMHQALRGEIASFTQASGRLGGKVETFMALPFLGADFRFLLEAYGTALQAANEPVYRQPDLAFFLPPGHRRRPYIISQIALPNTASAFRKGNQEGARVILARTAIAIRRYQLARGDLPPILEKLAPDYLDEPPVDPYTGNLIEYQVSDDSFTLRSAAADIRQDSRQKVERLLDWTLPIRPLGAAE